jgi:hypothetical protein
MRRNSSKLHDPVVKAVQSCSPALNEVTCHSPHFMHLFKYFHLYLTMCLHDFKKNMKYKMA